MRKRLVVIATVAALALPGAGTAAYAACDFACQPAPPPPTTNQGLNTAIGQANPNGYQGLETASTHQH